LRDDPGAEDQTGSDAFADSEAERGEPDYYAALGVRPDATSDEIRRAYHRLAKLWHPDRYMGAPAALRERAERRMRHLTAAYAELGDPTARRAYDQRRGLVVPLDPDHGDVALSFGSSTSLWGGGAGGAFARGPDEVLGQRGNPNGAGLFFGLLCGILALSILAYLVKSGGSSGLVAFGAVILLGLLALWGIVATSAPARASASWMEGAPPDAASAASAEAELDADAQARTDFEQLVDDALASIPSEFQPYLDNVVVLVKPAPTAEELKAAEVPEGGLLLGLYHGVSLTHQPASGAGPEEITIYQEPIERYCGDDPERIRKQVRATIVHELAHHFGIDHEDMPAWVR